MTQLYVLTSQLRDLERLADESDLPADALRDTLEGLTGEIEQKAANIGQLIGNLTATADAIDEAMAAMKARRERIQRHADWLKGYLQSNMQASGITKISCPYFTLALRKNPPKVVITDPGQIPCDLYVYPPAPEPYPDKKAIAERLKAGETVNGAHLEQGERLEIRA